MSKQCSRRRYVGIQLPRSVGSHNRSRNIFGDRVTLQACHTGSRRMTPTKGITFLQAQPSYQTHGALLACLFLPISINGFQGNDARSCDLPGTRTVQSRTLAFPRRTYVPEPSVWLRSTTVPWSSPRPRQHVVDDGRNTSRVRHNTDRRGLSRATIFVRNGVVRYIAYHSTKCMIADEESIAGM